MHKILEILALLPEELMILSVAALPVLELRASIPLGLLGLSMDWKMVYVLSVIGNLIPVPFIIFFLRPVFGILRKTRLFKGFIEWLETRTMKKAETVQKYSAIGLFIIVTIPLPGTGAWTGSMVAALLDLRMKYALPSIVSGVLFAGVLVLSGILIFQQ